jgi:hypothetical protein
MTLFILHHYETPIYMIKFTSRRLVSYHENGKIWADIRESINTILWVGKPKLAGYHHRLSLPHQLLNQVTFFIPLLYFELLS